MPVKTKTAFDFKTLQAKAAGLLETNYTPPQRYGTAFHLTPPIGDVREIRKLKLEIRNDTDSQISKDFEGLSDNEQGKIFETVTEKDPYLLWQVANIDSVAARILNVQEGQRMDVTIDEPGLWYVFLEKDAQVTLEHSVIEGSLTNPQTPSIPQPPLSPLSGGGLRKIRGRITENQGEVSLAISRLFVWQEAGSSFTYWGLRAENNFLTERVQVNLVGEGALAKVQHLTFGRGKQQSDIQVSAYHLEPKTESFLAVRTAAVDKHVSVYRGLIDIDEAAKGSVGYQQGRALLLSRGAVVDNLPELAIRTNDVRCSHGVNTTHIDDAALFYMRSRGLDRVQARQLAITGFYHDTMNIPLQMANKLSSVIDSST